MLIALGVEPEPGAMATTELATPDTTAVVPSLDAGLAAADAAVEQAVGDHRGVLDAVRSRIDTLLGDSAGTGPAPDPAWQPWVDVAELFVIDVHGIDDDLFAAAAALVGPSVTAAIFVGMALADARARLRRAAAVA